MNTFEMEYNFDDIMTSFEYRFCQLCENFRVEKDEYGNIRYRCTVCKARPYPKFITSDEDGNPTCRYFKEI